jgi:hypothetical protein
VSRQNTKPGTPSTVAIGAANSMIARKINFGTPVRLRRATIRDARGTLHVARGIMIPRPLA